MSTEDYPVGVKFTYYQLYGFGTVPGGGVRETEMKLWAKALCYILSGDGEASKDELFFAKGFLSSKGFPVEIVDLVDEYAREGETKSPKEAASEIKEILSHSEEMSKAGVPILHAAITAAFVDGLADGEVAATLAIAKEMGVSEDKVQSLIDLVKEEDALHKKRIKVLFPTGHPCLMRKFMPK
mmetsp:Transcript_5539/g.9918  ORF Transcript_5539/g.9918 Transcript_5539/m.9918 type:complete len:183 (-) Transcript_5539:150-698(-)|eukprot:CAMPEP_0201905736 /NCGR_PEP_ID=MMETSP0902-20130614/56661_1 /ASSEMBLY_ACC=CAM_ASM_000551 /TAXON_ID=420261 /ORGANISM="Thalassiosira antarctica, Strain CCMP982" /LENGTH=182 /DNA_ID=CAMNT_0048439855 /DNA_START=1538 /DNA_END=2086 /DNA_ORIENTATION=-